MVPSGRAIISPADADVKWKPNVPRETTTKTYPMRNQWSGRSQETERFPEAHCEEIGYMIRQLDDCGTSDVTLVLSVVWNTVG